MGKSLKIQIIAHTDTSNKHVRTSTRNLDISKIVRNKGKHKDSHLLDLRYLLLLEKKFKSNLSQWILYWVRHQLLSTNLSARNGIQFCLCECFKLLSR